MCVTSTTTSLKPYTYTHTHSRRFRWSESVFGLSGNTCFFPHKRRSPETSRSVRACVRCVKYFASSSRQQTASANSPRRARQVYSSAQREFRHVHYVLTHAHIWHATKKDWYFLFWSSPQALCWCWCIIWMDLRSWCTWLTDITCDMWQTNWSVMRHDQIGVIRIRTTQANSSVSDVRRFTSPLCTHTHTWRASQTLSYRIYITVLTCSDCRN